MSFERISIGSGAHEVGLAYIDRTKSTKAEENQLDEKINSISKTMFVFKVTRNSDDKYTISQIDSTKSGVIKYKNVSKNDYEVFVKALREGKNVG